MSATQRQNFLIARIGSIILKLPLKYLLEFTIKYSLRGLKMVFLKNKIINNEYFGEKGEINFRCLALSQNDFSSYLNMSDEDLANYGIKWIDVDECPSYPCRVSLEDAKIGERVLALSYIHHDVSSPYKASGPIFVRDKAVQANLAINEVPSMLNHRQLSIRGYSSEAMMLEAEVLQGKDLKSILIKTFQNSSVEYIQIHNAMPGCFNCTVVRA